MLRGRDKFPIDTFRAMMHTACIVQTKIEKAVMVRVNAKLWRRARKVGKADRLSGARVVEDALRAYLPVLEAQQREMKGAKE